ncbi:hypothetical protein BDZ45DRAFT_147357 [Acephala macrosclerotiorum]|nr:hypothetical protein BDZ45DRAFT_147357 [Acephala macrosclerotiorum]
MSLAEANIVRFNFEAFLSKIDPKQKYAIQVLTGGRVNLTVRATKIAYSQYTRFRSRFPDHKSLILKYAPPYIATIGKSAPFSPGRQLVEARALDRFRRPDGSLSQLKHSEGINVPILLHYCPNDRVLVLEDLAPLVTLYEYFEDIPSSRDDGGGRAEALRANSIGSKIGRFFSSLHSSTTRELVRKFPQCTTYSGTSDSRDFSGQKLPDLVSPLTNELILQKVVSPVEVRLAEVFSPGTCQKLYQRVLSDDQRVTLMGEQCFVLGDFRPDAILLEGPDSESEEIGVVDWEFSGLGRGPNGDMAQFLAMLHLLLMAARPRSQRLSALRSFIEGVCETYSAFNSTWFAVQNRGLLSRTGALQDKKQREVLEIFRSAFILHGREMINNAHDWHDPTNKPKDELLKEMVTTGAWYLERAGDTVEEMLDSANVEKLLKEDGRIMLRLFGLIDST